MNDFKDIETRGFDLNDMMQVGEGLLSAMVADEHVAAAWEENLFVDMLFEECQDAMQRMWDDAKAQSLAYLNRRFYQLNIERTLS